VRIPFKAGLVCVQHLHLRLSVTSVAALELQDARNSRTKNTKKRNSAMEPGLALMIPMNVHSWQSVFPTANLQFRPQHSRCCWFWPGQQLAGDFECG
jgi:hypothetical protein